MFLEFLKNVHTKQTLTLAWPIVLTQLGYIITGMVDTIFLGQIGPTEQAAGILSNNLFILILVFAIGMSFSITPLVTSAHDKNDLNKKASLFKNSLFINMTLSVLSFIVLYLSSQMLYHMQQPREVAKLAEPFFDVLIFSMIPVSLFFACKQYCEGLSLTKMALYISLIGNLLNIILNYSFIYGKLGAPEMGYMGSAWASFVARLFMGIAFLIYIFKSPLTKDIGLVFKHVKINWIELKELWKIGFNSAMQFTFEVAAFVIAGLMVGNFGKEQIDAHGIALSIASFTYMFGSGISSAGTIRVGIFKSQNNWPEIKAASSSAIKLVLLVMGTCGILLVLLHDYLPLLFTQEAIIIKSTATLLLIAAMFQLFDGTQVVIIGVLRGLEDVRIPTVITLIGYWLIALPLAYTLAYTFKLETLGIWIALLCSLIVVALGLLWRLNYLIKKNLIV